jgi:hypothetical protein
MKQDDIERMIREMEMNRADIIRMAQDAGIPIEIDRAGRPSMLVIIKEGGTYLRGLDDLERFAKLVAAAEREACAKVCDARYMGDNNREDMEARRCAAAIRARGDR